MSWFQFRVQHPFCPSLKASLADAADGPCTALAGSVEELRNAARRGALARKVIFMLVRDGEAWPAIEERDELWRVFAVPAYTIWLDESGGQLGWECEAQAGLHVADGGGVRAGFRLETEPCGCGRPGNRLVRVETPALAIAGD